VEQLYSKAIDAAKLSKDDVVFDAYCGIGTISLIASKQCKSVLGVEIVNEAIKDAVKNAKLNKIENAKFICGDAGETLEKLANEDTHFDCVFVDPPRKGLDEKFINSLLRVKPKKLVYVSCDPETLARDINILSKEYKINSIQPVDMFPMTFHVETVACLRLKER
jgi:23S rRNA (uracil1939-C5)-methyltransferase